MKQGKKIETGSPATTVSNFMATLMMIYYAQEGNIYGRTLQVRCVMYVNLEISFLLGSITKPTTFTL